MNSSMKYSTLTEYNSSIFQTTRILKNKIFVSIRKSIFGSVSIPQYRIIIKSSSWKRLENSINWCRISSTFWRDIFFFPVLLNRYHLWLGWRNAGSNIPFSCTCYINIKKIDCTPRIYCLRHHPRSTELRIKHSI